MGHNNSLARAVFRSERFCTVFHHEMSDSVAVSGGSYLSQTRRLNYLQRQELALGMEGIEMHPEDVLKPDLFSQMVLTGSGGLLFVTLLLIVAIALMRV